MARSLPELIFFISIVAFWSYFELGPFKLLSIITVAASFSPALSASGPAFTGSLHISAGLMRTTAALTRKGQIAAFQRMELARARLDAQLLRQDSPAFSLAALIFLQHHRRLHIRHLAELENHERICRLGHALDDGIYIRHGNTELLAQLVVEMFYVGQRLVIYARQKTVQVSMSGERHARQACSERQHQNGFFHFTFSGK